MPDVTRSTLSAVLFRNGGLEAGIDTGLRYYKNRLLARPIPGVSDSLFIPRNLEPPFFFLFFLPFFSGALVLDLLGLFPWLFVLIPLCIKPYFSYYPVAHRLPTVVLLKLYLT